MFHVFAAEVAGADGDLEKAAAEYLAAAMKSEDPEIAQRATGIAVAAQTWQVAAMAADRWAYLQPDSLEAQETAARSMLIVGDYAGAEHLMSGILDLLPDEPLRAWTIIAVLLGPSVNPDKANAVLDQLIEDRQAAGTAAALYAQSQLSARKGEFTRAMALIESAIEAEPGEAELHAWAGRLAANMQNDAAAMAFYRRAWSLDPEDRNLAIAYAELLKRQAQAVKADEVLGSLEDTPELRFTRISFALDAGQLALAEALFEGYAAGPYEDHSERAFYAGQSAEMLARPEQALAWYAQVSNSQNAILALLRRAFLLAELDRVDEAQVLLEQEREHLDELFRVETWLAESQILLEAGRAPEAFELIDGALQRYPDDIQLRYTRALVAVEMDRIDVTEQDLRRIIAEDPANASALNALGYTFADRTERLDEAEELIRAAFQLDPDEPSIIDSMGWVAYRQGRLEEAEYYLREAFNMDRNAEIAAHFGEVLWVSGKQAEARAAWARGLETEPDNPVLKETMARFGQTP